MLLGLGSDTLPTPGSRDFFSTYKGKNTSVVINRRHIHHGTNFLQLLAISPFVIQKAFHALVL